MRRNCEPNIADALSAMKWTLSVAPDAIHCVHTAQHLLSDSREFLKWRANDFSRTFRHVWAFASTDIRWCHLILLILQLPSALIYSVCHREISLNFLYLFRARAHALAQNDCNCVIAQTLFSTFSVNFAYFATFLQEKSIQGIKFWFVCLYNNNSINSAASGIMWLDDNNQPAVIVDIDAECHVRQAMRWNSWRYA